jgi:hypothetical protein
MTPFFKNISSVLALLILISCSSISKIKVVQQVKSTEKTTALADDSKQDLYSPK